jgi:hypothetical protein
MRALEAGDALAAAKARVSHGEWAQRLPSTGIPPSTARLYMQLARERDRIPAAGCTSIREARRLLAGTKPRADGIATARAGWNGEALPLYRKDLRRLVGLAHPDRHGEEKTALRATRVTQWLTELLGSARREATP